jgi:hypothetical protein
MLCGHNHDIDYTSGENIEQFTHLGHSNIQVHKMAENITLLCEDISKTYIRTHRFTSLNVID